VIGTRTSGRGGKVLSDGEQTRVATVVKHPPSVVFNLDEDSVPEPRELWFWDVRGYLVLRGVMDEDWLAAANRAIEATLEDQTQPARRPPGRYRRGARTGPARERLGVAR
jgi:hypothetical protein